MRGALPWSLLDLKGAEFKLISHTKRCVSPGEVAALISITCSKHC